MVSPEHAMIVAFNAMVPDDEYDPEFDLFYDYILRSIEEGPITLEQTRTYYLQL